MAKNISQFSKRAVYTSKIRSQYSNFLERAMFKREKIKKTFSDVPVNRRAIKDFQKTPF